MIGDYVRACLTLMGDGHAYCWALGFGMLFMPGLLVTLALVEVLSYTRVPYWAMRMGIRLLDAVPHRVAMHMGVLVPASVKARHRVLAVQAGFFLDGFDPDEWDDPDLIDTTTRARLLLALPWV